MQVTGQLWQLVVVHAELPAHLAALKNYFLLAKGDFYHSFLAEVTIMHNTNRLLSQLLGRHKFNAQHIQSADMIVECYHSWPRAMPSFLHAKTTKAATSCAKDNSSCCSITNCKRVSFLAVLELVNVCC